MLSMLAGHKRYAHIAALRSDRVLPELLDMSKIVSEDAVRRAFAAIEEEAGANWLRGHLDHCVEPLLSEPWDPRRRYDGEAALRPSGRSGGRLQWGSRYHAPRGSGKLWPALSVWRPASWRCFTIGGTSSRDWPSPIATERRSSSRPLLLHAIAERVRHARQTTIKIASTHAKSVPAAKALRAVALFLRRLVTNAEQLTPWQRWREILSRAFQAFLKGRALRTPPRLCPS